MKTIKWDDEKSIWIIVGQVGSHNTIRFKTDNDGKCPPSSGWWYIPGRVENSRRVRRDERLALIK